MWGALQYLEVSHGGEEYGEENADRALKRNETSIKVSIEKLDAARKSPGSHLWDSVAYLYYANLNEAMLIPVARFLQTGSSQEVSPVVAGAVFRGMHMGPVSLLFLLFFPFFLFRIRFAFFLRLAMRNGRCGRR
jgi:hypothetical protein